MVKIAPSILSADFGNLAAEIKKVEQAGADLIHVDVMDGHFVPNITIGPLVVRAVRKATKLPLDVHLMIENPDKYIPVFAKALLRPPSADFGGQAGADIITVQVEASKDLERDIVLIKASGAKPGVVVNPATPIEIVFPVLNKVAMVLIMSVNPGFAGQKFMPEVLEKVSKLKAEISQRKAAVEIEIDGGINIETAPEAIKAGADILVAGSAVFGAKDYQAIIKRLRG
ncbi:ribulose-phosphate 3-epimerase [candidate division WOR-1 bacterium RIFOXYB2_FULL_42_35]|uniref:Ribulose-phosphate 3-epimerase n=1 Tax=candidate division WOR-1 bacterium RIFOXYC2_FULL_41_25 TaxID=1802586 RepID=A0A1F4TN94_UNCSA|nr:MAG: ribulose-phosphate 3-epimerase [candidate division WOR-1 bacterium RIFOXYA2_FULL_41_14]OGC24686.1 MAG: ribulose-phosphate 3-epimerase [candidate division WOR-1 bacterium RIFOXYB2_FULL_42_35]OGC34201.1 MAG: ribulose-phosphate 3-epimerase [candidate division WOR-1 bacterium RIFOXYC2_FULL_41_25]OGC41393.1 MAG: ribulose-phosphate 3-epimerase [candidate division WOR-1 bacterium RIFOXYD2_FULL_41_8]